jgi:hypothetical protein
MMDENFIEVLSGVKEDVDFEDIGRIYYYVFDFLKYLLTIFKELYL